MKDEKDPKSTQWQSHNTGVVNFAYHLKELPPSVSKLAFVHEIGHSFGSPVSTGWVKKNDPLTVIE